MSSVTSTTPVASCLKLPYGYQIDLDFIKYCESLTNPDPNDLDFKRRQKRRQRQSMEVMLGIQKEMQDEMDRLSEIWEKSSESPPEPPPRTHLHHHHVIESPIVPSIARGNHQHERPQKWDQSLLDVVDDFEKTLERTNSQRIKRSQQKNDCVPSKPVRDHEVYKQRQLPVKTTHARVVDKCDVSMLSHAESALIQNQIRDLEEKTKLIPVLQFQIQKLKDERQQLLMQLERASASSSASSSTSHTQNNTTTTTNVFQPQRVSPVSLSPIKMTPITVPKRTIGINTTILVQRDVGCSPSPLTKVTQSASTDLSFRVDKDDGRLYTEKDLRKAIEMAHAKMRKSTSTIGVQSEEIKPSTSSTGCGTEQLNLDRHFVEGISIPSTMQPTALEDPMSTSATFLSLQDMTKPPTTRSNSTQTQKQQQIQTREQSTQFSPIVTSKATESIDLIRVAHKPSMTEIVQKRDQNVHTNDLIRKSQIGINTDSIPSPVMKTMSTNTSQTLVKNVGITTDIQPEFVAAPINTANNHHNLSLPSKIPRHQVQMSPNANRKFTRQDTFTVSTETPETKSKAEQECPAEKLLRLTMASAIHQSPHNDSIPEESEMKDEENQSSPEHHTTTDDKPPSDEKYFQQPSSDESNFILTSRKSPSPYEGLDVHEELSEEDEEELEEEDDDEMTEEEEDDDKFFDSSVPSTMRPPPTSISTIRLVQQNRLKIKPSKEMISALKVVNDMLKKPDFNESEIRNAREVVACEWFHISSTETSKSDNVEDYLDYFEEQSWELLTYMVNLKDKNGNSSLHYAVSHRNFDVVSILLDSKVGDVNKTNNAGYTCVMLVSLAKELIPEHQTVVRRLFKLSDVNIRASKNSQTALMLAVSHGNFLITKLLIEASADINIQDDDGSTALMCAAEHGYEDIVKFLLAQPDCDSCKQDVDGNTALKIALEAGYHDIGCLLYAHEHILRNKTSLRRTSSMKSSTGSLN